MGSLHGIVALDVLWHSARPSVMKGTARTYNAGCVTDARVFCGPRGCAALAAGSAIRIRGRSRAALSGSRLDGTAGPPRCAPLPYPSWQDRAPSRASEVPPPARSTPLPPLQLALTGKIGAIHPPEVLLCGKNNAFQGRSHHEPWNDLTNQEPRGSDHRNDLRISPVGGTCYWQYHQVLLAR